MSTFWTIFIAALVVINLLGCIIMIYVTGKPVPGQKAEDTSHVWDGDLTEYNKPLPAWWVNLFYGTIIFTIGYLVYYPGVGAFPRHWWLVVGRPASCGYGRAGKTSRSAVCPVRQCAGGEELAKNGKAVELGHSVFANNCAMCHGSDAKGNKGFPNLTDAAWNWGGTPDDILNTVLNGRQAAMPSFAAVIGNDGHHRDGRLRAESVRNQGGCRLGGRGQAALRDGLHCLPSAPTGTGNPMLGAPNLTDADWLYGSDIDTIKEGIIKGRAGMMPPHKPIIGKDRARLVAAYVYSLTNKQ